MRARTKIGLLAAAAVVATAIAWPRRATETPPAPASEPARAEPAPAVLQRSAPSIEPVPAVAVDATTPTIELRDGTVLPALNGVTDTSGLKWPADRSRTPVVGVLRGQGNEVYVHEDGSQTSTIQVRNLKTGEVSSSAFVAHPIEVDPAEIEIGTERGRPVPLERR